MPLPKLELGLVVQYGFVWAGANRRPPPDADKSRPCLVVDVQEVAEPSPANRVVQRVTYLPISHVAPGAGETAIAIPPRVAQHLGLTYQTSYLYTSYAVEDDWPFDLETVPGAPAGTFDYGLVPPKLFAAVTKDFSDYLDAHPHTIHRRSG